MDENSNYHISLTILKQCRICGNKHFNKILSYKSTQIDGFYFKSPVIKKNKTPITLLRCAKCGLFQLHEIINNRIYKDYNFSSQVSLKITSWQHKAAEIIKKIMKNKNANILEIGSGDGSFLCNFMSYQIIGIEPSKKLSLQAKETGVPIINSYFSSSISKKFTQKIDFVIVRHVFEHINVLKTMVVNIVKTLKDDGYVYIESPYVCDILRKHNYSNIFFEHVNYFCITDMVNLFKSFGLFLYKHGFNDIHNGSFYCIFGKKKNNCKIPRSDSITKAEIMKFKEDFKQYKISLKNIITKYKKAIICGYGGANKTSQLLSLSGLTRNNIDEIYDKNQNIQNLYIAYSDIPIVAPIKIMTTKPDYLIIFASAYEKEIIKEMMTLGYKGKFIRTYPTIKIL